MKTKIYELYKNGRVKQIILAIVLLFMTSCSKKDDEPVKTKLVLPAVFENNVLLDVPNPPEFISNCAIITNVGMEENTIVVDKDGSIVDPSKVSLELDLSTTNAGEIVIEIIAPSGESCALIKRPGITSDANCGSDFDFIMGNKLTFNSAFTNGTIANQVATGNYAPLINTNSTFPNTVAVVSLSTFFTGKNIKGIWKIKASDYGPSGARLKVHAWKLKFDIGALQ